jgi:anthranilate phosphoribosyltransferase
MAFDPSRLPAFIKEIGRGRNAARDLSREDAHTLFSAMLFGEVPDLQLGGILVALRIKGESMDELAGFMAACEDSYEHLRAPRATPVVIPSYNGARQLPNLVPLFAMLLARAGIPTLVHGVMRDPGRVSTRDVFEALGFAPADSIAEASAQLDERRFAFMPIERLAPRITSLLDLRASLGVRNSAHTLVKMLQPFAAPALRIVSVTHPEYVLRMREFYTRHDTGALILRGAEGEAVAHPRREPSIDWAHGGNVQTWTADAAPPADLPSRDAAETARWIERVLAGEIAVPAPIAHQFECVQRALKEMQ